MQSSRIFLSVLVMFGVRKGAMKKSRNIKRLPPEIETTGQKEAGREVIMCIDFRTEWVILGYFGNSKFERLQMYTNLNGNYSYYQNDFEK